LKTRPLCPEAPCPDRRPAFTLIEVLAVMGTMGIVLVLATATLVGAQRINASATEVAQRLAVQAALADQFRQDVTRATTAPDAFEKIRAGPACIILQTADSSGVIYRWEDGQLERTQFLGQKQSHHRMPVGSDQTSVEFLRSGPGGRVVTLRLSEPRGNAASRRVIECSAALGGDCQ
jgi:type II secretory pathway pseudopilin PulG